MADSTITNLSAVTTPASTDVVAIVNSATTKKVTIANLVANSAPATLVIGAGSAITSSGAGGALGAISFVVPGTGIAAALAINTGSAGAPVLFNGAGGTPSSLTLTSGTGLPVSTGLSGAGTGVLTALGVNVGTAGAIVVNGGALGVPSSGTGTNITGIPAASILAGSFGAGAFVISTSLQVATLELGAATDTTLSRVSAGVIAVEGVNVLTSGATGVQTFLTTPSSANLRATLTDELGTGAALFDGATPTSFVGTNISGTAASLTAGNATNTGITDDTTTNATMYPTWVTATSGNLPQKVSSSKLTFNPSTGALTTTTFVGALTGTASGNLVSGGALGTPSSGTVTNLTGTASININGTVGATTPGTGAFTSVNVSGSAIIPWGNTYSPIEFGGNSSVASITARGTSPGSSFASNLYNDNTNWKYVSTDLGAVMYVSGGDFTFYTTPSGTAGNTASLTSRLAVQNAGTIVLSSGVTNAAGTPGSICYNTATFELTKNNALTCTVSSRLFKKGVSSFKIALPILNKLRAVQFAYKDQPNRKRLGFIAEELAKVDRRLADNFDEKGRAFSIDQNALLSLAVEAIQELGMQNQVLNDRLETLYAR